MTTSQNGWPVFTSGAAPGLVALPRITGRVRAGDVATILGYVAEQFHARVEPVVKAHSWGYAFRAIRGTTTGYSNHASGTAIDLNAPAHPLGVAGTFTAAQVREITKILSECQGTVRWGGHYSGRVDEMHFEIHAQPSVLARAAAQLTTPSTESEEDIIMALSKATKEEIALAVWTGLKTGSVDGKTGQTPLDLLAADKVQDSAQSAKLAELDGRIAKIEAGIAALVKKLGA